MTEQSFQDENFIPNPQTMGEAERTGRLPHTREGVAIELAIRAGEMLTANGVSAHETVVTMQKICRSYGVNHAHFDITYIAISASYFPGSGQPPFTSIRVVRPGIFQYYEIAALELLVEEIEAGKPLMQAVADFDRIRSMPKPYPNWVASIGTALIPTTVQIMFGASLLMIPVAFLLGLMVDQILKRMNKRGYPVFFQHVTASAAIVILLALTSEGARAGLPIVGELDPTLMAVGGIIQMVAGMKIVGASQDAIDGYYVTASARILEVIMLTGGIVIGLLFTLQFTSMIGYPVYISISPVGLGPVWMQYVGATMAAMTFVISGHANFNTIWLAGLMGFLGWLAFSVGTVLPIGEVFAYFLAGFVPAFAAMLITRSMNAPSVAVIGGAILPLVPGLRLYFGLMQTLGTVNNLPDTSAGLVTFATAIAIALAIASGASLGAFLGRPTNERLRKLPVTAKNLRFTRR